MVDWSFCGAKIARAGSQLVPPFVVREKIASPRKRRGSEQDELALFEHYGVPYTDQGTGGYRDRRGAAKRRQRWRQLRPPTIDDAMTRSVEELRVGTASPERGRVWLRK
jgi:hypothetical protein